MFDIIFGVKEIKSTVERIDESAFEGARAFVNGVTPKNGYQPLLCCVKSDMEMLRNSPISPMYYTGDEHTFFENNITFGRSTPSFQIAVFFARDTGKKDVQNNTIYIEQNSKRRFVITSRPGDAMYHSVLTVRKPIK